MGFLRADSALENDVWSVAELTNYVRELFEIDFRLRDVSVAGEISNFTRARSGHLYFTLKDAESQLKCVMWRSSAKRLRFQPQDGDAVVAHGRMTVYSAGGVYQLAANSLEPAGRGDLALAFERLKEQLAGEGLFDEAHKQPIPAFPRKIGIVTSADAAALRDILNVLERRYPIVEILIAPTLVQGNQAPVQIVQALRWLDGRYDIDSIIVARGGGSIEDLWAFNDEQVARAIFAAQHPVISGVGHETDFTIADFVADLRAPTPSAAAELAVPDREELAPGVLGMVNALSSLMQANLQQKRWQVERQVQALRLHSPVSRLDNNRQQLDNLLGRLDQSIQRFLQERKSKLMVAQVGLTAVSPLATLARGYAIVRDGSDRVVSQVQDIATGDSLTVQVSDGTFDVVVGD